MLRIIVHEHGKLWRLELAGRLEGPWIGETERAWRSCSLSARQIEIDVRQLTALDDSGRELLSAMHRTGARLIAEGIWMTAVLDEITTKQPFKSTAQPPRVRDPCGPKLPTKESKK